MTATPFVSILVINFNGKKWLQACFASLEKLDYPKDRYEVMMGDNASTDDSISWTKQHFPWVKIISFDQNYGFCKANNLCVKEAKGEYLVFLNNDTFVEKDWLRRLVEGVVSEPGIVSCTPKIFCAHIKDAKVINSAGSYIFPTGGGIYIGWFEQDSPEYNVQKYTGYGAGCGVLVAKEFFLRIGGFDEYYFYGVEEMDLGYQIWLRGYKVLYVPTAVMYHYMGRTALQGKGSTPAIEFLMMRNGLYFIFKNLQFWTALNGFFWFNIKAFFKILHALSHGNFRIVSAIARAYFHFVKDLRKTLSARRAAHAQRTLTDRELYRQGVLLRMNDLIKAYSAAAKKIRTYFSGNFYETKDTLDIRIGKKGELHFYEV